MFARKIFTSLLSILSFALSFTFAQEEQPIESAEPSIEQGKVQESFPVAKKDVSEEWKQEVSKQFEQDVEKIKKIIVEGEKNKKELQDFLNRFEDQKQWFDASVSVTKNFFDPSYNSVMQKKLSFKRLVKAQERADEFLKELVDENKLSLSLKKQIRLAILYQLNFLIQKEEEKGRAENSETGLSDVEIRKVVTRVFSEIERKKAEEKEVERVVRKDIEELEKTIENFKNQLEKNKQEKSQLESKVQDLQADLKEKKKSNDELKHLLKKIEKDQEMLKEEMAFRTRVELKKELKPVIERKNKENIELQTKLKQLEQDLKVLGKSVKS